MALEPSHGNSNHVGFDCGPQGLPSAEPAPWTQGTFSGPGLWPTNVHSPMDIIGHSCKWTLVDLVELTSAGLITLLQEPLTPSRAICSAPPGC